MKNFLSVLSNVFNKLKTTKDIIKEVIETENDEVPDIATIHVNKETIGIQKLSMRLLKVAFSLLQISQEF